MCAAICCGLAQVVLAGCFLTLRARLAARVVSAQDSNWHSTEGDKRDDLSNNSWFTKTQALAGDKKFIKKTGNWACESSECSNLNVAEGEVEQRGGQEECSLP
jgi:hypothetical protein